MEGASSVRISNIQVKKDKNGTKYATIEILRVVDEGDQFSAGIALALQQMRENKALLSIEISESVLGRNLVFFAGIGVTQASEAFHNVELRNFRVKRERVGEHEDLVMKFRFTVKLEEAFWTLRAIGDDVLCVVEESQPSLPGM